MPTVTLSANTSTWTVPAGVTVLQSVTAYGAGGGGGSIPSNGGTTSGGGGGGAVSIITNLAVTPGAAIACQVPAGRADGVTPDDTWFSATNVLLAKAGSACPSNTQTGAQGGQASAGVGSTKYSGGDGASGVGGIGGGGGGSSAGSGAAGVAGSGTSGGTAPTGGGSGGAGAANEGTSAGSAGSSPGGGGGGAVRATESRAAASASAGGAAQIVIFYDAVTAASATAAAGTSSTSAAGSSLAASGASAAAGLSATSAAGSSVAAVSAVTAAGSSATAATGSSSVATGIYPPSLPVMRESSTQRLTGIEPARASNGALRVRRYAPGEKMVFSLVHWLSDAQRTQLETTYTSGRTAALQFLWPEDGATYTVRFADAPQYERKWGYWVAQVTLLEV